MLQSPSTLHAETVAHESFRGGAWLPHPLGLDRHGSDDSDHAGKPGLWLLPLEPALPSWNLLHRRPRSRRGTRFHSLRLRRLAVCLPLLPDVCERRDLRMVVRGAGRVRPWVVSIGVGPAAAAVRPPPDGVRVSWSDRQASARAARLHGHELWLRHACDDAIGPGRLRCRARRLRPAAAFDGSARVTGQTRMTVVVRGGSAGIGRAVALEFARHGWNIGLIARAANALDSIGQEIEAHGAEFAIFPADVADAEAVFEA